MRRDNGFEYIRNSDKKIDDTCYTLHKFTDMYDKSKSIEIYVQVLKDENSIFDILQPSTAKGLRDGTFESPCDEYTF